jgi:O-methyltransferase
MFSPLVIPAKAGIKKFLRTFGYDIVRYGKFSDFPRDFQEDEINIIRQVRKYTLTSNERLCSLIHAVRYLVKNNIAGDIVECGVWKGGSIMAAIKVLQGLKDEGRSIYLYDTFEGMVAPTDNDTKIDGTIAKEAFEKYKNNKDSSTWCRSDIEEVQEAVYSTGYDRSKIHFVKGKVEETIPQMMPEKIALLRLDTDWYESTKHEMVHLFPRLVPGGVLILDDYGSWFGARKAVDEYLSENKIKIFLSRIDNTGRVAIK